MRAANESNLDLENSPHIKRLEKEMVETDTEINNVRRVTHEEIEVLEEKKRNLRRLADPNAKYSTGLDDEQNMLDITKPQLDRAVAHMDMEISRIQAQHDEAVLKLQQKKQSLQMRLTSLEKLDLLISAITYRIFEVQYEFRTEMEKMAIQRELVLNRTVRGFYQCSLEVAELDRKIEDCRNTNEAIMMSLQGQRTELQRESALKTQHMDSSMNALKMQHDIIFRELQEQKLDASPSGVEEINRRIMELNKMLEKDVLNLKNLQEQGWRNLNYDEKISEKLEERGLRVTHSGHFLTLSGRHLTRSQASCLGLLEGIQLPPWEIYQQKSQSLTADSDKSSTQISSVSTESCMPSEDIHYLKTALGKPLALALAEITAKQPRDPIHYLGHWLFKYRYNQEVDYIRKHEIQELMDERERIEKEEMHALIESQAHQAVLDMIVRAEEEAIRDELERIAREAAMLEAEGEELEAEARDVLGVYDGPSAGQRIGMT